MIHACFNFDDDTDEIVKIPEKEDPRRKIHHVDFSELRAELVEDVYMRIWWRWNDFDRGIFSMSVETNYALKDGRFAHTVTFGDEKRREHTDVGSSRRVFEDCRKPDPCYNRVEIILEPHSDSHVPIPIRRWIYHVDTTMRNKRCIGKMQAKWRRNDERD